MHTIKKNIVISGGSRGLGLHLCRRFLLGGNRVAAFARSETPDVTELRFEFPEQFLFRKVDAVDAEGIRHFVAEVRDSFGSIDGLVNNAAIGQDQLLMHTNVETISDIVNVNVIGVTLLTRAVVKVMVLQGAGSICSISSICGSRGYAGLTVYAGTKGYIDALTRSLAREVGRAGILINNVAPGFFESEMSSVLLPEQLATIRKRTPTGKLCNEEDIFLAVDLLISGKANMQGQVVYVDGGITI